MRGGERGQARAERACLAAVIVLSLGLSAVGLGWGLPHEWSWSADSIGGLDVQTQTKLLWKDWSHRYPPGQFLVLSPWVTGIRLLRPELNDAKWADRRTPREPGAPPALIGLTLVFAAARMLSALMGVGAVVAVFLCGRELFEDWRAGLLASLLLATSQIHVFHSHVGNVDVPMLFWYCWAVWAVICSVKKGRRADYLRLGLFAALAFSTKEAVVGYLVGLALAVLVYRMLGEHQGGSRWPRAALQAVCGPVWLSFWAFAAGFLVLSVLASGGLESFVSRIEWWSGEGTASYSQGLDAAGLLRSVIGHFMTFSGRPLVCLMGLSVVVAGFRWPKESLFVVLPPVAFFLLVLVPIEYVYPRFELQAIPSLALAVGGFGVAWLEWTRRWNGLRWLPLFVPLMLASLSTGEMLWQMVNDSRYRAEDWLLENSIIGEHVASFGGDGPRLHRTAMSYSYRSTWPELHGPALLEDDPSFPRFVVVTERSVAAWAMDGRLRDVLLSGNGGYEVVARFGGVHSRPSWLARLVAPNGFHLYGEVSPEVIVVERRLPGSEVRRIMARHAEP